AYYEASWMSLKGCLNPAVLDAPVCRYPIKSLEASLVFIQQDIGCIRNTHALCFYKVCSTAG
ncbi:MAG: hypothetical protein ACI9CF_001827, partial [Candidatus Omnitrophota bacterium]